METPVEGGPPEDRAGRNAFIWTFGVMLLVFLASLASLIIELAQGDALQAALWLALAAALLALGPSIVLWLLMLRVPRDTPLKANATAMPTSDRKGCGAGIAVVVLGPVLVAGQAIARSSAAAALIQQVVLTLLLAALTGIFSGLAFGVIYGQRRFRPPSPLTATDEEPDPT